MTEERVYWNGQEGRTENLEDVFKVVCGVRHQRNQTYLKKFLGKTFSEKPRAFCETHTSGPQERITLRTEMAEMEVLLDHGLISP